MIISVIPITIRSLSSAVISYLSITYRKINMFTLSACIVYFFQHIPAILSSYIYSYFVILGSDFKIYLDLCCWLYNCLSHAFLSLLHLNGNSFRYFKLKLLNILSSYTYVGEFCLLMYFSVVIILTRCS